MSNTIKISENVSLTWLWGGEKKKTCIQITNQTQFVELTRDEMKNLVKTFIKEEKEKYPKRKRKCLGCGRA